MPALASEVFGLAHLAGNYSLLSVRQPAGSQMCCWAAPELQDSRVKQGFCCASQRRSTQRMLPSADGAGGRRICPRHEARGLLLWEGG